MKNRTDRVLLALLLLSLPLAVLLFSVYLELLPVHPMTWPYWVQELHAYLAFGFPAVPFFCLQLLLCRRTRRRTALLPAGGVIAAALVCVRGYCTASGWDTLGWLILLLLTAAPAAGCALAWAVWGLGRRGRSHG